MSELTQRIAHLSPEKREVLERLLKQKGVDVSRTLIVPRKEASSIAPLSFGQRQMWIIDKLSPGRSFHNLPNAARMRGPLDIEALEKTLGEITRRHESLRTTFTMMDGNPVQVIGRAQPCTIPMLDICDMPEDEREQEMRRMVFEDTQLPFDLEHGPLMRGTLIRLGPEDHVLVLTMHHIISDGWSRGILISEVVTLYTNFSAGLPSPLPELPVQYADYSHWQHDWFRGDVLESLLSYWRKHLADAPPVLELPTDRPRPSVKTFWGDSAYITISESQTAQLRSLGQAEGATLFMTLLAAFAALLARYSGQEDILVSTPIAGRTRSETERLIGFFVNTLVLRTDLSGDPSFRELLRRVREVALGAYSHQELPFEKLVDELQPDRNASSSLLFQVMFVLQNAPHESLQIPGLRINAVPVEVETSKFDMTLTLTENGDVVVGSLQYNTDLFDASTISRFMQHFHQVLHAASSQPDLPLSQLPLLSPEELHQLLSTFNDFSSPFPSHSSIHQLFEAQVALTPERIALSCGAEQLTYQQLNERANKLAHYLRRRGVAPESLVGISMKRSVEMAVAVLGTLKAGGGYVPLDAGYPMERLRMMVEDAGVEKVLVSGEGEREWGSRVEELNVEKDAEEIGREASENGGWRVEPENVAYVIYTSGSTGRPKGVPVPHRGLCNLAVGQARAFGIDADSRVLQFAPLSFDAAASEMFTTWVSGATLYLVEHNELLLGQGLIRLLRDEAITTVTLPPAVLSVLPDTELPDLRTIIVAGDVCPEHVVVRWSRDRQFINAYGPTEGTVCATIGEIEEGQWRTPIGRPMANVEVYILDARLQPVPIGVAGQMYLGGVGLARGYLKRGDLTAERFIPHPYSSEPGARLYQTGDKGRFMPDGQIEFLGRIDQQLKIRGYRIEPGEVETVLRTHQAVRETVVIAREDEAGEKHLAAYVVTHAGTSVNVGELRRYILERLPEYMTPGAFTMLDELPLTSSGKIDRRALPALSRARPELEKVYTAPGNAVETLLAGIWQQTLDVEVVGVYDDFFELGGNSIKAAVIVNKLQELLGEYVYVVALFDAPTISALATLLCERYPHALSRLCGPLPVAASLPSSTNSLRLIDSSSVAQFRTLIPTLPPPPAAADSSPKNRRAVFLLSPPRSGSTLLRVMLAGHPRLFAPPELELLAFNTLRQRRDAFAGRNSFWVEGTLRAIMALRDCDADQARLIMQQCEEDDLSVRQFYALMQQWAGERTLVDKTPSYALDVKVLGRAEEDFAQASYIYLVRHPYGMIRSFEEAKLDQVFFRHRHEYPPRELAELIWVASHQNIRQFLQTVDTARQHVVKFEELVREPKRVLEGLCRFIGEEFKEEMLEPYCEKGQRMTDGIHELSKMLGDVKFHQHKWIKEEVAERWRGQVRESGDELGEVTWELAEALGYERLISAGVSARAADVNGPRQRSMSQQSNPSVVAIQPLGTKKPFFCVHPGGGDVFRYVELARHLGQDQPFYGIQTKSMNNGGELLTSIEEMASYYIESMKVVQPEGPYCIGGWSMGGIVAFEMARQLHARGEKTSLLALMDAVVPESNVKTPDLEQALLGYFALDLGLSVEHLNLALSRATHLGPEEQLTFVLEQALVAQMIPASLGLTHLRRQFEVFRINHLAIQSFELQLYMGQVTLLKAVERVTRASGSASLGWDKLTEEGGVDIQLVPGNHYTMMREPYVKVLAGRLGSCINKHSRRHN
jgi:amino acid adenylation domain-containing protein